MAASTPDVSLRGISKRYGEVVAIDHVELDIAAGEFFTMLGPSGSGKTTTLRMIAGFDVPDTGRVEIAGQDVTDLPAYDREVNTVFQDYALFPHMTVAENVEYGLRVAGVAKDERSRRATEALEMIRLGDHGARKPAELSGGQRQRVALARAIVNRPRVLLLDEPLGALDLKLREQMQVELKSIQSDVGITFIYVTHDQEEALTMSDRVAVFNEGRIEQVGPPAEIYERPQNPFVAGFVGTSNLLERDGRRFTVRPEKVRMLERELSRRPAHGAGHDRQCRLRGDDHEVPGRAGGRRHAPGRAPEPRVVLARRSSSGGESDVIVGWLPEHTVAYHRTRRGRGGAMSALLRSPVRLAWLLAVAMVSIVFAAGCGDDDDDDGGGEATADLPTEIGEPEGELNLVTWAGYAEDGSYDPKVDWVTDFEKQTGCEVNVKVGNTSDEMVQLISQGGYDGVSASGDASGRLYEGGYVQPVNTDLVPNYEDIADALKDQPYNTFDGVNYGIPNDRGWNVLMYNTEEVNPAPKSWDVVFPGDDFSGQGDGV